MATIALFDLFEMSPLVNASRHLMVLMLEPCGVSKTDMKESRTYDRFSLATVVGLL